MASLSDRPTHLLMRDMLFEALRVKDERLNALAVELRGRFEEELVRRLVLEACDRKNSRAHRLRALRAVKRVGPVTDPLSLYDLGIVTRMGPNAEIRAAVSDLLVTLLGVGRETPAPRAVKVEVKSTCPGRGR